MSQTELLPENQFLLDMDTVRARLRSWSASHDKPQDGIFDPRQAIDLLQTALAAEILCVWRYTMMSVSLAGLRTPRLGAEFQEQANDERCHMRMLAERIEALGGVADFSPEGLETRIGEYGCRTELAGLIEQNLAAERSAIDHYRDLLHYFEGRDRVTSDLLENILRDEENHAADMHDLLALDKRGA